MMTTFDGLCKQFSDVITMLFKHGTPEVKTKVLMMYLELIIEKMKEHGIVPLCDLEKEKHAHTN